MRALTIIGVIILSSIVAIGPAFADSRQLWRADYAGEDSCGATAVSITTDPNSGVVYMLAQDGGCPLSQGKLVAYSPSGTKKWTVATGTWTDVPVQVAVDPGSHDVLVASFRGNDLLLQAWSSAGHKLWGKTYGIPDSEIVVDGLAVDGHGDVFVGATVQTPTNSFDFLTSAYRVSDGSALWHVRYDGNPHQEDDAVGIAVDPANKHVYVTGTSENGERDQVVVIAYAGASGTKLWGKRATEDTVDLVQGIAVDPTNHQVYALTEPSGQAVAVVHAYTSSGTPLWHTTAGTGVIPRDLAVDPGNDHVYVDGFGSATGNQAFVMAFTASGSNQ